MLDSSIIDNQENIYGVTGFAKETTDNVPNSIFDDSSSTPTTMYEMCTLEEVVDKFIPWSPTIVNDTSAGYMILNNYCPTYAQIKNSQSLSVTLYRSREEDSLKWEYVSGSLTGNYLTIVLQLFQKIVIEGKANGSINTASLVRTVIDTSGFGSLEEDVANALTRNYPPSYYMITTPGTTHKFKVSGRLAITIRIKHGPNSLEPDGEYTYYTDNYHGILDKVPGDTMQPFEATFCTVRTYKYSDGITYKFNGEVGQFPKLKMVGQYEETADIEDDFVRNYSSKSLVRLKDILGIYNKKRILFRLHNIELSNDSAKGVYINSGNSEFYTIIKASPIETTYDITDGTQFSFSVNSSDIANLSHYSKYEYSISGKPRTNLSLDTQYVIDQLETDLIIDIYAIEKARKSIFISLSGQVIVEKLMADGTYSVIHEEIDGISTIATCEYETPNNITLRFSVSNPTMYPKYIYNVNAYDYSDPNQTKQVEIVPETKDVFVTRTEDGNTYGSFVVSVDMNTIYQNYSVFVFVEEAFKPKKITFKVIGNLSLSITLGKDGSERISNKNIIDKYSTEKSGSVELKTTEEIINYNTGDGYRTIIVYTAQENEEVWFDCSQDWPIADDSLHGWIYLKNNVQSSLYEPDGGEETAHEIISSDTKIIIRESRISFSRWELEKNSEAVVTNNLTGEQLSNGVYYTTSDENNTTVDLKISVSNFSTGSWGWPGVSGGVVTPSGGWGYSSARNTDAAPAVYGIVGGYTGTGGLAPIGSGALVSMSNHDRVKYVWQSFLGETLQNSETNDVSIGSGVNFKKTDLRSNLNYKLTVETYKQFVQKTVYVDFIGNTYISAESLEPPVTFVSKEIMYGAENGYRYIFTMPSGNTIKFKLKVEDGYVSQFKNYLAQIAGYIKADDLYTYKTIASGAFDSNGECTITYNCSSLSNFNNIVYIHITVEVTKTTIYEARVKGDGVVQLGLVNSGGDINKPTDVSLWPKDTNVYNFLTDYDTPENFKIKIMCNSDLYTYYSYQYADNDGEDYVIASSSAERFDAHEDLVGTKYNVFDCPAGALATHGSNTILTVTAKYDTLLYKREVDIPFMLNKRSSAKGPRPIFARESNM